MTRPLARMVMAQNSNSGSPLLWLWIVVAVIGIVAVAMLISRRPRHRAAVTAGWHTLLTDAYAKGSALYDAMSLAESPAEPANGGAAAGWAGLRRSADDLTQDLYNLRETAPDEMARSHVSDVLASLQAVRRALDSERRAAGSGAPGDSRAWQGARAHDLLLSFGASLRTLR